MAISNEGLAIKVDNLSAQILKLETTITSLANDHVRTEVFELRMREMDTKLIALKLEIAEVERSTRRANWRTHTLTAAFTVFLTLLITYVFNDYIGR